MPTIKVLLIDDEPDLLDMSRMFLELDKSMSVDTATSADDALEQLKHQEYDVIVSDYQMPPGKDGIQLLKEIRTIDNKTSFILFTGRGREEVAIQALNAGADYYLQKGGNPRSQFAELNNFIIKSYQKHQMELSLKENEEKFKDIFNSANDSIYILHLDGRIQEINDVGCDLLGYTKQELLLKNVTDINPNEDVEGASERLNEVIKKGSGIFETVWITKDGKRISIELNSRIIKYAGKTAILSVGRDISERKENNIALVENETRLRAYLDNAPEGIFIADAMGNYVDVNRKAGAMLNYTREELLKLNIEDLTPKYMLQDLQRVFQEIKQKGAATWETLLLRKDCTEVPIFLNGVALPNHRYMAFCTDITERVLAEKRFNNLFDVMKSGVAIYDVLNDGERGSDYIIRDFNKRALEIEGKSREEVVGRSLLELRPTIESYGLIPIFRQVWKTGVPAFFPSKVYVDDCYSNWYENTIFRLPSGEIAAIYDDVTDRMLVSEKLKKSESSYREINRKLNLLSSITRHDIRSQLMGLEGNLAMLQSKHGEPEYDGHLRKVEFAAKRISAMINFSKEYEDIGVNAPIWQNVHELVKRTSKNVQLGKTSLMNDIPTGTEVFADPMILKVFQNLMDNAIRHGGNITKICFSLEEKNGEHALVCEDDGVGISPEMRGKLFTKGAGKEHGFGLFLSREILAITGITIEEEGERGKGAKFVLSIPANGIRETK